MQVFLRSQKIMHDLLFYHHALRGPLPYIFNFFQSWIWQDFLPYPVPQLKKVYIFYFSEKNLALRPDTQNIKFSHISLIHYNIFYINTYSNVIPGSHPLKSCSEQASTSRIVFNISKPNQLGIPIFLAAKEVFIYYWYNAK